MNSITQSIKTFSYLIAATAAALSMAGTAADVEAQAAADLQWIQDPAKFQEVLKAAKEGVGDAIRLGTGHCSAMPDGLPMTQFSQSKSCARSLTLPAAVQAEVDDMIANRFQNESDYDSRLTELKVFRLPRPLHQLSLADWQNLVAVFGLESVNPRQESFEISGFGQPNFLRQAQGLWIQGTYVEKSSIYSYLADLLGSQPYMAFQAGATEITLYPGGGFIKSHTLILAPEVLIYLKREGWNS